MARHRVDRRAFLRAGAAAGAAFWAPTIIPAAALGLDGRAAPSERIVLGTIGTGGRGQQNVATFLDLPDVQVVGVADVDRKQAELAAALVDKHYANADCRRLGDFRELLAIADLDAVCVSTPDHWHALICVAAATAGKDIYCETPLAHSIDEGRAVCDVVRRTGRILQCGVQERSNPKLRHACELVRTGRLGDLKAVHVQMPTDQPHHEHVRKALDAPAAEPVPDGLDFDFWLGPAAAVPYTSGRCHFWWRYISQYGGGELTDRGAHLLDLARLGAGKDAEEPVSIRAAGTRNATGLYDAFLSFEFVDRYEDGLEIIGSSKGPRGLRFVGTGGTLFIAMPGGTVEADPKSLLELKLDGFDPAASDAPSHHRNFIDCVKSRRTPLADAESAQRTAVLCQMNNVAMAVGRDLTWDAAAGRFAGDDEANTLLRPSMRSPWTL